MNTVTEFSRICPICNNNLYYSTKSKLNQALKRNTSCHRCMLILRNKTREYTKREKNSQWLGYRGIPYSWFSRYFLRGNKTKRTGNITIKDVYDLWMKQNRKCALTGISIGFYDDDYTKHTCSIDRIDSKKEYTLDNIQLVHKDINLMKNKFSKEYFIEMCKRVAENAKEED